MTVGRMSLAVRTEIGVVTNGALVAVTSNPISGHLVLTKGAVAVDTLMEHSILGRSANGFIDRYKSVSGMAVAGTLDTSTTVIPVGAVHTFVADSVDVLQTISYGTIDMQSVNIPSRNRHRWQSDACYDQERKAQ